MSILTDRATLRRLISTGTDTEFQLFYNHYEILVNLSEVQVGIVAPTYKSFRHTQYLNTATNKYYRNVDGGTTWVALN